MTKQTDAPLTRLNLQALNRTVEAFHPRDHEDFDLNPPYQRGSVWTTDQRIELIRSFMTGTPIPALILNYRGSGAWTKVNGELPASEPAYAVVDGKQRVETVRLWFSGDLAVPASWFPGDLVKTSTATADGPYVTYNDLTTVGKRISRNWTIPTAEASVGSIADEAEIYLRVNGAGTDQSQDDLDNAASVATSGA